MSTFAVKTTIDAPVGDVWDTLADIGEIHRWNPGVKASHVTTSSVSGEGACRRCDLGGSNFLDEEVVEWDPEKRLTMRITDTNLPFASADIRFLLEPAGQRRTTVTVSPVYAIKYGLLGKLMDRLYVRGTYRSGMCELLTGLKAHLEAHAESAGA